MPHNNELSLNALRAPPLTPLLAVLALCLALAGIDGVQRAAAPAPPVAVWPQGAQALQMQDLRVQARGAIPMPPGTPAAHASSLLPMPADSPARLMAFWFAGQRESAHDVQIAASWLSRSTGQWQPARIVANREQLGAQMGQGVRRIGNPVAWRDAQGRVHLFVVATGMGGWAASRVVQLRQTDGSTPANMQFEPVRVLPLSWLWNTSQLVRTAPLPLADGGMLLPLYFELGFKYAMLARLGPGGEFLGLQRISGHDGWLQPSLLMLGPTQWLALMRDHSSAHKLAAAQTDDAGRHWRDLPPMTLDNPDASVAVLGLRPGLAVLAHNPSNAGRELLRLSASADGLQWSTVAELAGGTGAGQPNEYSYPAVVWQDGQLWVSYTDQRQRIGWVELGAVP